MKLQIPKDNWKSRGPPPLIFYNPDPTIRNTQTEKVDSLNFDINTQPVERDSETVVIYLPLFWAWSPESLIKFVTILHKIILGQYI